MLLKAARSLPVLGGRGAMGETQKMTRALSSQQDLELFEKEARNLLHDLRRSDTVAVERYFSIDPLAGEFEPGLADAQYVVARQHGFKSWQELKEHVLSTDQDFLEEVPWYLSAAAGTAGK